MSPLHWYSPLEDTALAVVLDNGSDKAALKERRRQLRDLSNAWLQRVRQTSTDRMYVLEVAAGEVYGLAARLMKDAPHLFPPGEPAKALYFANGLLGKPLKPGMKVMWPDCTYYPILGFRYWLRTRLQVLVRGCRGIGA